MKKVSAPIILFFFLSLSCSLIDQVELTPPTIPLISPSPTTLIMADSFFYGKAFVDANGNDQIDPDDPPLKGALFIATDARGLSGGDWTKADGHAMAWWPSGSEYPITLRMEPPDGSGYTIIGPEEVVLEEWDSSAEFLFKPPEDQTPASEKRCGDRVCDGPENAAGCPEDCAGEAPTPSTDSPAVEPGPEDNTFWLTNPTSGARLFVRIFHPNNWKGESLPTLVLVPGGIGSSEDSLNPPSKIQKMIAKGFTIVLFDPDGRGQSQGSEDFDGSIHQDGLAEVIRSAANFPGVDADQIGLVSYSYGITMASGTLTRYPDLPVRFLIDWEGPADRYHTTTGCGPNNRIQWADCSDEPFWSEREAVSFIRQIQVPYQRLQSEKDHVQPNVAHAVDMVNAAIEGGVPWVRLNDLPPDQTYNPQNPPEMLPEGMDGSLETLITSYAEELFTLP